MRILFLTGEHPEVPGGAGGIGSFVASASTALAGAGHEVHVLVCAAGTVPRDSMVSGVAVHARGLLPVLRVLRGRLPRQLAITASCRWHARRLGPVDVVEAPEWQALAAAFAVARPAPLVVALQTPSTVTAAHDPRAVPPTRACAWLERWVVRRADAVLSLSQLLVDELRRTSWLPAATSVAITPAVLDHAHWSSAADQATDPVVVGIGRLEPRKGFDQLLAAAATLPAVPGLRVLLLGRDTEMGPGPTCGQLLATQAASLGVALEVRDEVPRHELATVLATARVVVLPSTFDSFNMAGLEALACGRPVVVTDRVGLGELADGTDAVTVVPAGRVDELAAAIASFVGDASRAAQAGHHARALVDRLGADAFAADRIARYERAGAARSA